MFRELHRHFKRNKETLYGFAQEAPTDEVLKDFIGNKFGIFGGSGMNDPKGTVNHWGRKNPRMEFLNEQYEVLEKLEGSRLLNAICILYHIPRHQQLCLF